MQCAFVRSENGITCRRCGQVVVTDDPPERCHAVCEAADCRHLGDETRRVGCSTCGGNVQIKVFACGARGEATLAAAVEGIACCATCDQYEPGVAA